MFHFLLCFLLSQCPTFSFFYFFFTLSFSFSSPKLHSLLLPLNIFSHFFTLSLLPSPPLPSSPPYSSFRHHNLLLPLLFPFCFIFIYSQNYTPMVLYEEIFLCISTLLYMTNIFCIRIGTLSFTSHGFIISS